MDLKVKEQLTFDHLCSQVENWVNDKQHLKLQCVFKYPTHALKLISLEKIKKIIQYTCHQQLNDFFVSKEPQKHKKITDILYQIQQYYYEMSISSLWKENFYYEFSLVYLVKIISAFCSYFFKFIKIDFKFESQLFIILIHLFLGTNVSRKSFRILEKKYVGKLIVRHKKKKNRIKESKLHIFLETTDKEFFDLKGHDLKQELKNSLYVKPLPKLNIKRKSLRSLTHAKDNIQKYKGYEKIGLIEEKLKKKSMQSTQLSSSMKTELKKHKSFISMNTKPFKINNRLPYNGGIQIFTKKQNNFKKNQYMSACKSLDQKESNKISSDDWLKIITKIKDSIIEENAKMQLQVLNPIQDKKLIEDEKQDEQNPAEIKLSQECLEKDLVKYRDKIVEEIYQLPLEKKVTKSYEYGESEQDKKEIKKDLPNSKDLKVMKRSFEELVELRRQKIAYSIFSLPGIKHNLKMM